MLRSSSVYGIGGDRPKFIHNFINKIKLSEPIVTHQYNNGLPALDLLYIDDFVEILVKVVNSSFAGNLNVGTGVTITTKKIAEILRELSKGSNIISSVPIFSETASIAINSEKAKEIFEWKSKIDIEEGLRLILSNSPQ
jgi:nucleoside-diphosphate-sugar epimerase